MRLGWVLLFLVAALAGYEIASGRVERLILSIRILDELRRPGPASWLRSGTLVPHRRALMLEQRAHRFAADVYYPGGSRGEYPLILVPGMVEQGKDDPRVAPFAALLARAGFVVVVPDLPSLRMLRVQPENEDELADVLDAVVSRPDLAPRGRAGIFGVSYAGGLGLLVALDPGRAGRIPFVALVGGYADLDTTLSFLATGRVFMDGRLRSVVPDPYGKLVFLRTYEEFLTEPRDIATLETMAARRAASPQAPLADLARSLTPRGRLIYDLLEGHDPERVPAMIERLPQGLRRRIQGLSPARHGFSALKAHLYVVHARDDGTFPSSEAARIASLARPYTRVRLVILDELQHVEPERWSRDPRRFVTRDLPEAWKMVGWWYELLGERGRIYR